MIDYLKLIQRYYQNNEIAHDILLKHSRAVADKALELATKHKELDTDMDFVEAGAMLHDIGILMCDAKDLGCHGKEPYIKHGTLGAEILRKEGLEMFARVCERHTGTGITKEDIIRQNLPLELKDYSPVTLEEKLICYADKFFSKTNLDKARTKEEVVKSMAKFGEESTRRIKALEALFG